MSGPGRLEAIAIAAEAGAGLTTVEAIEAIAGQGLRGDRYATGSGRFSDPLRRPDALSLIAAEALEALAASGVELSHSQSRRNLPTRGIDLNALVGRRFTVGAIECQGIERADPCNHLQRLTRPGVLRGLVDRGGLRAAILSSGTITIGDTIADTGPTTG